MELNLSMYLTNAISFANVDPSFPFPIIDQLINQKLQMIFFRDTGPLAHACVISLIKSICFVESDLKFLAKESWKMDA